MLKLVRCGAFCSQSSECSESSAQEFSLKVSLDTGDTLLMQCSSVFMIHKPVGVVCATVDANLGNIIRNTKDERYGLKKNVVARPTVYELARLAGFPDNYGLVGRLDTDTSGVMLFTSHSELLRKVRDPAISEHDYQQLSQEVSYAEYCRGKTKVYELLMLSGKEISSRLAANGGHFDSLEFECELSKPFDFNRNGEEHHVDTSTVKFIERFQDPKYSHGKSELGWCIRCSIELCEGKHHQIRRMAHNHGYHVRGLKRVALIGGLLRIDSVPNPGDCRWLTTDEVAEMCRLLHITQCSLR